MRLVVCIIGGAVVLCGSLFITLWLTEPEAPPQRLEDQRISHYNDLPTAAQNAGFRYSEQMKGSVDGFSRINEHEVKVVGWVADPLGDSTPSKMFVFLNGSLVASGQTSGELPSVTQTLHLSHGAEKNLGFSLDFNCRPGDKPVVLGVGERKQYILLPTKTCP
jgi:hypothetical protein